MLTAVLQGASAGHTNVHDDHRSGKGKVLLEPLLTGDKILPPHISLARPCPTGTTTEKDYATKQTARNTWRKALLTIINLNVLLILLFLLCRMVERVKSWA